MKSKTLILAAFMAILFFSFSLIQNDWRILGERSVKFSSDKDVIKVGGNDWYDKLKIKVVDAPLHIGGMEVFFENGEKQDVNLRQNIRQGGESRVIDLPEGERRIDRIEFRYHTTGRLRNGTENVIVFGRR